MPTAADRIVSPDAWLERFDREPVSPEAAESGHYVMDAPSAGRWQASMNHQLALIVRGEGVCRFRTQRRDLYAGAAVWVQPGVEHAWEWGETAELVRVGFRVGGARPQPRLAQTHLYSPEAWSILKHLEQVLEELALPMPQSPRRIKWLLALGITDVMRQHFRYANPGGLSANQRSRLVRFVSGQGLASLTVGELADLLGLSDDYFARRFRQTFDQSPRGWLMRQRMLAAGRLLRDSGLSITQAAAAAGYTDISQFSRQFRRTLGIAPSRYRRG